MTGPAVDSIAVRDGSGLDPVGEHATGVLDPQYADENGISAPARITVAGGGTVDVAGLGNSPETFVVIGPGGSFSSEAELRDAVRPARRRPAARRAAAARSTTSR